MRDIEQPFDDAYVESFARIDGEGAVPYLPNNFFSDSVNGWTQAILFGIQWFANYNPSNNYFQLMGASSESGTDAQTSSANNLTQVMVQNIIDYNGGDPQTTYRCQSTTNHEMGHQFDVNPSDCLGHDLRSAWCDGSGCSDYCLMDPSRNRTDNVDRFDTQCLVIGETSSGDKHCGDQAPAGWDISWTKGQGAIRTETDPK